MMSGTVAHCFNQNWTALFQRHFSCFPCRKIDGTWITSIDPDSLNSIALATDSDTIGLELLFGWSADGIAIVATEKHNRHLQCCCKVKGSVEISFTCCTISKESHRNIWPSLHLECKGSADGMGDLRCQNGGDGVNV